MTKGFIEIIGAFADFAFSGSYDLRKHAFVCYTFCITLRGFMEIIDGIGITVNNLPEVKVLGNQVLHSWEFKVVLKSL